MAGTVVNRQGDSPGAFDWTAVAEAWDENHDYVERSSAPITERLVADLDPRPGDSIVELGAGAGELGLRLASAVRPGGRVIISDVAEGMVALAARRVAVADVDNVDVRRLDGQAIDLPDDHADAVVCRMGYMLMPDPAAAFGEARRILRRGGRLVFSVWAGPQANAWAVCLGMAVAQAGLGDPAAAFQPGGLFSLADEVHLRELVVAAAFDTVSIEAVDAPHRFDDFDSYWSTISRLAGPVAALVAGTPADRVARVKDATRTFAEPYAGPDGLHLPGQAMCVVAR